MSHSHRRDPRETSSPAENAPAHRAPAKQRTSLLRIVLPALIILAWLAAAGVGGPYFGKVSEVSTNDSTAYLPTTADATQVQERLPDFLGSDAIPAIVVITGEKKLTEEELSELGDLAEKLADLPEVSGEASPPIPSEDGEAVQIFIPLDSELEVDDAVETLRGELASQLPGGLDSYEIGRAHV